MHETWHARLFSVQKNACKAHEHCCTCQTQRQHRLHGGRQRVRGAAQPGGSSFLQLLHQRPASRQAARPGSLARAGWMLWTRYLKAHCGHMSCCICCQCNAASTLQTGVPVAMQHGKATRSLFSRTRGWCRCLSARALPAAAARRRRHPGPAAPPPCPALLPVAAGKP